MRTLAICISTYKRPKGLERLLQSIEKQKDTDKYFDRIIIAVADNETPPLTEIIVKKFEQKNYIEIRWAHEPRQGITYARNTTFRLAEGADYCFFTDDDQILDDNCLSELFRVMEEYKADMVYGNTPPVFVESNIPSWIKQYHNVPEEKDGKPLIFASTNCLLIDKKILDPIEEPFDNRFAHTGGEDTFFTMDMIKKGYKLVKSGNAKAYNLVPKARCLANWILKRVMRESALFSFIRREVGESIAKTLFRFFILSLKIFTGVILTVPLLIFGFKYRLKGLILILDGVGGMLGYFSYKQEAY